MTAGFATLWLLVPLLPLLAILPVLSRPGQAGHWVVVAVLPALALAFWPQPVFFAPQLWPSASWGVEDLLGRTWLAFTAVVWGVSGYYAAAAHRQRRHELRFFLFWLMALSGNLLLVIARDGVSFYVGFTLMSLSAYGLVIHSGRPEARRAGLLYLQLAILGEMLLLAGLAMRAHAAGVATGNPLALDMLYWQGVPVDPLTLGLILVGLGIKTGFWPLHIWLPQAHPVAPAAASAVLSGSMIKAGILGLWRFLPMDDPLLQYWAPTLMLVGLAGALLAALQGLFADRPKSVLAWSSVSQMGYLLMILSAAWLWPDARPVVALTLLIYACHHAFAKGALFLGAGAAASHRLTPLHWGLMALPALAMAGMPLTSGALAKTGLKALYYQTGWVWLPTLLGVGSVMTALLLLRFAALVHRGQRQGRERAPAPRAFWLAVATLALATVLVPWLWPAWRAGMVELLAPESLWSLLWPLAMASILAAAVAFGPGRKVQDLLARFSSAGHFWVWASLRCRRLFVWLPLPGVSTPFFHLQWRSLERRWNWRWRKLSVVPVTASLMLVLLLLGWLW